MGKTPKTVRREPNGSGGQCMVGSCTLEAVGLREIAQIVFFFAKFYGAYCAQRRRCQSGEDDQAYKVSVNSVTS